VKTWQVVINGGLAPSPNGKWIHLDDLFPLGPDGARHPTKAQLIAFTLYGMSASVETVDSVFEFLTRIATVAPEGKQ
jgi:hypothetical protein